MTMATGGFGLYSGSQLPLVKVGITTEEPEVLPRPTETDREEDYITHYANSAVH